MTPHFFNKFCSDITISDGLISMDMAGKLSENYDKANAFIRNLQSTVWPEELYSDQTSNEFEGRISVNFYRNRPVAFLQIPSFSFLKFSW